MGSKTLHASHTIDICTQSSPPPPPPKQKILDETLIFFPVVSVLFSPNPGDPRVQCLMPAASVP